MPLARIFTNAREDALPLARRLEAHGYTVEITDRGEGTRDAAELEIELDKMDARQALAQAARLSQGKQVNVFVAPGSLDASFVEESQAQPEPASVAERLLDALQETDFTEPEPVPLRPVLVPEPERNRQQALRRRAGEQSRAWIAAVQGGFREFRGDMAAISREFVATLGPVVKKIQRAAASGFELVKQKSTAGSAHLTQRWNAYREARATTVQHRQEAKTEQMRHAELEHARHLLEQQEERRREAIHKRMGEQEREKQRLIQEQLRRVRQAEEEERRQAEREAQLERQRQEALRLAQERERVARERVEQERIAEEARRLRAEEAERRRQEREEQVLLQRREALKFAEEREQEARDERGDELHEAPAPEQQPIFEPPASVADAPAPPVPAFANAAHAPQPRFDSDLNSPYHPGWTWAAAAAGAATVAIMLLWTAVSASHSKMEFAPLSPSSLMPRRATDLQQQVPFGPVKVVVRKAGGTAPVKVVPAVVPVAAAPVTTPPVAVSPKAPVPSAKPSAAKRQMASSDTPDASDASDRGPEVVVRHFAPPTKPAIPQAGQTATVKRYSDMN